MATPQVWNRFLTEKSNISPPPNITNSYRQVRTPSRWKSIRWFFWLLKSLWLSLALRTFIWIFTNWSNSSCASKIGTSQTRSFSYLRGVRQRCILSPLPFNLYVNDLPFAFQNTLLDPIILPNGTNLNSLLYADDLIIISDSRSKIGLQNCLNTLSSF